MKTIRINISLDEYTLSVLDKFSTPKNISRSQLVRLSVMEYVKNHTYDGSLIPVVPFAQVVPLNTQDKIKEVTSNPVLPKPKKKDKTISKPIVRPSIGLPRGDMDADNYL